MVEQDSGPNAATKVSVTSAVRRKLLFIDIPPTEKPYTAPTPRAGTTLYVDTYARRARLSLRLSLANPLGGGRFLRFSA